MPVVTRRREVAAALESVWRVVANPDRLAEWWPGVERVEEASPQAWTTVMASPTGRAVRMDYSRVEQHPRERLVWRQEVEASPFERILHEAEWEISLEPDGDGTNVALTERTKLRGWARFGGLQWRLAARRRLAGALDGLARTVEAA